MGTVHESYIQRNRLKIYADGASQGNPGPSGIGVIIYDQEHRLIKKEQEFIGDATNNEAEYRALIYALIEALILKADRATIYLDSELVTNQINGLYKVKNAFLRKLYQEARHLMKGFKQISVRHIGRSANRDADRLAAATISRLYP